MNKWFAVQAAAPVGDALTTVKRLINHPVFDYKNPNKVRSVLGAFGRNLTGFNRADGEGYRFLAGQGALLDRINPKSASSLLTAFAKVKKFDTARQEAARAALAEVLPTLSPLAQETVERILTK